MVDRLKRSGIISGNRVVRRVVRDIGIWLSRILSPRGVKKDIGGAGTFLMSHEFTFYNSREWGRGRNNGFNKLIELAEGKRVVFDVGAHVGLCTMPISQVLSEGGKCYAFEPAEGNLRYLRRHIEMNRITNVVVVPELVGDVCAERVEFFEAEGDSGMNSVLDIRRDEGFYRRTERAQITLDHFVSLNGCVPELIKIDVEGAEIKVISGSEEVMREHRPDIILSVHPRHLHAMGHECEELLSMIKELDYEIYNIDGTAHKGELRSQEYHLKYAGMQ
jgi:FkbM family methyltransferase